MSTVGIVTTVSGRRDHLARQMSGLRRQHRRADHLVVVRMDRLDISIAPDTAGTVTVLDLWPEAGTPQRLPLAAARNLGVRATGTDAIVLLDVDCIPGAGLVDAYRQAVTAVDGLVCGAVRYLGAGTPETDEGWSESGLVTASRPHAARPSPGPGRLERIDRHELAWTTSLALRRESFDLVGGFDERFSGYGAEDTDFAVRAAEAGLGVWWTDDAVAFHQYHGSSGPPVQHLDDIVRNAALFQKIHGWYPMHGWLDDFRRRGLIDFDPAARTLVRRTEVDQVAAAGASA